MVEHDLAEHGGVEEGRKALDEMHPIGHIGEPDDIAYGVVYLASEESKFVTGAELVIDGGYTAQQANRQKHPCCAQPGAERGGRSGHTMLRQMNFLQCLFLAQVRQFRIGAEEAEFLNDILLWRITKAVDCTRTDAMNANLVLTRLHLPAKLAIAETSWPRPHAGVYFATEHRKIQSAPQGGRARWRPPYPQGVARRSTSGATKTGAIDAMPIQHYDIRDPDGVFVTKFRKPVNLPILDDEGRLVYLLHHIEDVTNILGAG